MGGQSCGPWGTLETGADNDCKQANLYVVTLLSLEKYLDWSLEL